MATAGPSQVFSVIPTWLIGVGRRLGPEGLQLLKALYCNTLPFGILADEVKEPRHLYDHTTFKGGAASPSLAPIQEGERMPPQDSLALLIHRLSILVPESTQTNPKKRSRELKLGAQDCLEYLQQCGITRPQLRIPITPESRLLECVVRRYVNMTQDQRKMLKTELGQGVGLNADNVTIFEIIGKIFQKQGSENKCEGVLAVFVRSLQQASSQRMVFEELQQDLDSRGIPHEAIPIPDRDPSPVDDQELVSLIDERLHSHSTRKCTKKNVCSCFCLCLSIVLGLLVIAVAIPLFLTYTKGKEYSCEDSSHYQMRCPNAIPSHGAPAAILVGRVSSFWYDSVSISQVKDNADYQYYLQNVKFFVMPSHQLHVYSMQHSCNRTDSSPFLQFDQLYLLKESTLNFTICVRSKSNISRGVMIFIICDSNPSYNNRFKNCLEYHFLYAESNTTNCSSIPFTAPHNGFYYMTTNDLRYNNATLEFFHVDIDLRYLNSSDWHRESACSSNGVNSESADTCRISIERNHLFQAEEYTIVATVTGKGTYGKLEIKEHGRSLTYVIPAVAAAALILLGVFVVVCVGVHSCVVKRMGGKRKGKEMGGHIIT